MYTKISVTSIFFSHEFIYCSTQTHFIWFYCTLYNKYCILSQWHWNIGHCHHRLKQIETFIKNLMFVYLVCIRCAEIRIQRKKGITTKPFQNVSVECMNCFVQNHSWFQTRIIMTKNENTHTFIWKKHPNIYVSKCASETKQELNFISQHVWIS